MTKNLRRYEDGMNTLIDQLQWTDLVPDPNDPHRWVIDPISGRRWNVLTTQQLKVAEELVNGATYRAAAKAAGLTMKPESASTYVCTLLRECAPFVNEVLKLVSDRRRSRSVSLESHLQRLDDLGRRAEKEGKWSSAIAAEIARGRAGGLYTKDLAPKEQVVLDSIRKIDDRIQELVQKATRKEREVQGRVVSDKDGRE
jgi:hypothetical protein